IQIGLWPKIGVKTLADTSVPTPSTDCRCSTACMICGDAQMVRRPASGLGYRTARTDSESTTHSRMMSLFNGHALRARMITGPVRKVGRIIVQLSSQVERPNRG